MQKHRCLAVFFGLLLAVSCSLTGARAQSAAPFAITAANVTMPSVEVSTTSGGVTSITLGSSAFTVTGIPGAGTLTFSCRYSGPVTQAKIPQECGLAGAPAIPITAGETTLNGNVYFVPYGLTTPSIGELHNAPLPSNHFPATGMALAGALMLGLGLRRRTRNWLALVLFAVGALAGAAGISACGGNANAMTPGTYQYTIAADYAPNPNTPLSEQVTTNITLTVQ